MPAPTTASTHAARQARCADEARCFVDMLTFLRLVLRFGDRASGKTTRRSCATG